MKIHAILFTTVAVATLASGAALAGGRDGGGSSSNGDSWLNDAQRNPRYIEPGADNDPARYRVSHPTVGYADRQAIAAVRSGYRGRIYVRPGIVD